MTLDVPSSAQFSVRQWLLNVGQEGRGAHHWIWNRNDFIQFGTWGGAAAGGRQIGQAPMTTAKSLATVWDGTTYELYLNGQSVAKFENVANMFKMTDTLIAIGGNRHFESGGAWNFQGCIHGVD